MSLSQEQAAFLLDACATHQIRHGARVHGHWGRIARTPEQQALHVKAGRSKTMNSIHLKRLCC
jgi:hypothetical protein